MAFWFFALLLFAVGDSKPANPINQSHLQSAMADMRKGSYHGFVLLLKIVNNSIPDSLRNSDITFFMPNDEELSEATITSDHLPEFIFSHSMPTALHLTHLLHLPNGTLVPSNIPSKIINVTNSKRSGLFVNNAKIVTPDVCGSSTIRCHGISTTMRFENFMVTTKKCNRFDPPTDLQMTPTQH
ncbi:uncharacterized protein LOC133725902 [Rosa rugosa]|uniref:uncharacterized protein LOC133725902 n=1 Tax=Rosa rugosa TaxID=74645 RepID=UPI002B410319|nr:uncharacterized protein LOC133725902 [Rosa rugosa]